MLPSPYFEHFQQKKLYVRTLKSSNEQQIKVTFLMFALSTGKKMEVSLRKMK